MEAIEIVVFVCAWIASVQTSGRTYSKGNQRASTGYLSSGASHTGANYHASRTPHTSANYHASRTSHTSANPKKDFFFEETRRNEYDTYKVVRQKPAARNISFKIHRKKKSKPLVTFGQDSVFEMFRLMSQNKRVAGNTAANSIYVGGGYSVMPEYRDGKGTQEEGVMALMSGLLTSLLPLAKRDRNNHLLRTNDSHVKGRFVYEPGTFSEDIWLSENMHPRVSLNLWEHYKRNNGGCNFFTDYVANNYSNNNVTIRPDNRYDIDIYSIVALDRRGKTQAEMNDKYNDLYFDTFGQISAMLKTALKRKSNAVVITVPGSGVFSNVSSNPAHGKDNKYLKIVEKAVVNAIRIYGWEFDEIVLCGHRSMPEIFY